MNNIFMILYLRTRKAIQTLKEKKLVRYHVSSPLFTHNILVSNAWKMKPTYCFSCSNLPVVISQSLITVARNTV